MKSKRQKRLRQNQSESALDRRRQVAEQQEQRADRVAEKLVAGTQPVPEMHPESRPGDMQPLDPALRSYFEQHIGPGLGDVHIHTGAKAAQVTESLEARAFTVGNEILFNQNEYAPETTKGLHLLAHELAHVAQQGRSQSAPAIQCKKEEEQGNYILSQQADEEPYEAKAREKAFSEEEQQWIQEVMNLPEIRLLFQFYSHVPPVVLHRVKKLQGGAEAESSGRKVAISSRSYQQERKYREKGGESVKATKEEEFKSTLIHELFHFFVEQVGDNKKYKVLPQHLLAGLLKPQIFGFKKYAFGWFKHPKLGGWVHFDVSALYTVTGNASIIGNSKLMEIKRKGEWESSPMPQSGKSISPEEDMATTLSLYLTSNRSRTMLKSQYPKRHQLMESYFKGLRRVLKERQGSQEEK